MKIEGVESLKTKLKARADESKREDDASVIVGYAAAYALFVHENIEMKWQGLPRRSGRGNYWDPAGKGQAKFLEEPARRFAKEIGELVRETYKRTKSLAKSLLVGGYRLQRESQDLVPIDTGTLRASGFVRLEKRG